MSISTTPESFRTSLDALAKQLHLLTIEEATAALDALKVSAAKVSKRTPTDDLDDMTLVVALIEQRLQRRWIAERWRMTYTGTAGVVFGSVAMIARRGWAKGFMPGWAALELLAAGAFVVLFGLIAGVQGHSARNAIEAPLAHIADVLRDELAMRPGRENEPES